MCRHSWLETHALQFHLTLQIHTFEGSLEAEQAASVKLKSEAENLSAQVICVKKMGVIKDLDKTIAVFFPAELLFAKITFISRLTFLFVIKFFVLPPALQACLCRELNSGTDC